METKKENIIKKGKVSVVKEKETHTLITHIVSQSGFEIDSVIEVMFPKDGVPKDEKKVVKNIVEKLEKTFMNVSINNGKKHKNTEDGKKLSLLINARLIFQ